MSRELQGSPESFARRLSESGGRAWIVRDPDSNELRTSHDWLADIAALVADQAAGGRVHEGVFLEVGARTGALLGAFLHRTERGQAQGGCRHWRYDRLDSFLNDGLRLAVGMGRKSALAGLWWGGGKGLIACPAGIDVMQQSYRRSVFAEFGAFVSSLRGAYVTAEDAGTTPQDVAELHRHTRFVTCIPPEAGGSGNPSSMTAAGVIRAMEAARDFIGSSGLHGCTIAMQGAGNVGAAMIEGLLDCSASRIVVSEISAERCSALEERFAGRPVEVLRCAPEDTAILAEPCDVLVPNALGGVLDSKTIPEVRAALICGAANNPLLDDERDAARLEARGIAYVPDFVANRMGIVNCANEQYGSLYDDPAILRHFDGVGGWEGSIYNVTQRVLERARSASTTSVAAANRLADERAGEPHPIWGDRTHQIVASLVKARWHQPPQ
jgi:leucine dehydrogenase